MGEFADIEYWNGFDNMLDDSWMDADYIPAKHFNPNNKTCNRCGKSGLYWKKELSGWRLQESTGVMHICERHQWGDL